MALVAPAAWAQSPPTTLISGSTQDLYNGGRVAWCGTEAAPTTFQRASTGVAPAFIGLEGIYYTFQNGNNLPQYFRLAGQAVLTFTTPAEGRIVFPYPASYPMSVRAPNFAEYQQSYDAQQKILSVTFLVLFQNCALRVSSVYRQ